MSGALSDTQSAGPMVKCAPAGQAVSSFGWAKVPSGTYA
jgi:hypothetical protein